MHTHTHTHTHTATGHGKEEGGCCRALSLPGQRHPHPTGGHTLTQERQHHHNHLPGQQHHSLPGGWVACARVGCRWVPHPSIHSYRECCPVHTPPHSLYECMEGWGCDALCGCRFSRPRGLNLDLVAAFPRCVGKKNPQPQSPPPPPRPQQPPGNPLDADAPRPFLRRLDGAGGRVFCLLLLVSLCTPKSRGERGTSHAAHSTEDILQ